MDADRGPIRQMPVLREGRRTAVLLVGMEEKKGFRAAPAREHALGAAVSSARPRFFFVDACADSSTPAGAR